MKVTLRQRLGLQKGGAAVSMTEGPIAKSILMFAIPLFMGQLLQQFYNMADAWVIGNFADNDAFAAVSSAGSMTLLIVGLFNGIAIGGGVIISKYYGAGDKENVVKAIHTNFLFGIIASILSTVVGLVLVPHMLNWMNIPESVMPNSLSYFQIYFGGVSTVIMYNICMSIMRALGDSIHPLYYLMFSSAVNVVLDLLFGAVFDWGVAGAATATVIAQGLSVEFCLIRMCRSTEYTRLDFRKLHFYKDIMLEVIKQGLPTGIQTSVSSIGNIVVQSNINSFGAYAMAGVGAYAKIEGFVFLPIMSMSMALPTFISQNLGAGKYDRVKQGQRAGILMGFIIAVPFFLLCFFQSEMLIRLFMQEETGVAMSTGVEFLRIVAPFYFVVSMKLSTDGALRGSGAMSWFMIATFSDLILRVVLGYVLAVPFGTTGIWMSWPIGWAIGTVMSLVFFAKGVWKQKSK